MHAWDLGVSEKKRGRVYKKKAGEEAPKKKKKGRAFKKDFAVKRRKLTPFEATQLLWYHIYPEHYVEEPYPGPEGMDDAPEWLRDMDFNPRAYINMDEAFDVIWEGVQGEDWKEWAAACAETGEDAEWPLVGLVDPYSQDLSIGGQLLQYFGFPEEAKRAMEEADKLEEEDDDWEAVETAWETYLMPYLDRLGQIIDKMMKDRYAFLGWFRFGYSEDGDFGLLYYECGE